MTNLYKLTLKCWTVYALLLVAMLLLGPSANAQITYVTEDGIVRSSPQDTVERYYTNVSGTFEIPVADVVYVTLSGPTTFSFTTSWRTNHLEDVTLFVDGGDVHTPDYSAINFLVDPVIGASNMFEIYRRAGVSETWQGLQIDVGGGGGGGASTVQDDVTTVSDVTTLDFTGAGVVVTDAGGGVATVTIEGGGGSGFLTVDSDLTAVATYDITVPDPYLLTDTIIYAGGTTASMVYRVGTPASPSLVTDGTPGQITTSLRIEDVHLITGGTVRLEVQTADTGGNTAGKLIIAGTEL